MKEADDFHVERYLMLRADLRKLLGDHGIKTTPQWNDVDLIVALRGILDRTKEGPGNE